jgi:type III pantothenate kinase
VLATNTVNSLQSGLYYGYLGLIDGILERLMAELDENVNIVATGGLAPLMGGGSKYIREIDDLLTLEGLRIIYERNQAHVRRRNEHAAGNETPEGSARETISSVPKPD